jgi:predicted DNA-binding transcriptional regulator YafY
MAKTDRLAKLKLLFDHTPLLTKTRLLRELEVSEPTLKRDLALLRDRLNAPVVFDRDLGGWRLDRNSTHLGTQYEMPGMWFSAEEMHALLTMQHLLANLDAGGLLQPHIEPLRKKLARILGTGAPEDAEVGRRIKLVTLGARRMHLASFQAVGTALLRRQRLLLSYRSRGKAQSTEREVSPQRLVHYRDNWYLDAWCHLRRALRNFSVDAIEQVQVVDRPARDVPETELDAVLGAGYGIFSGQAVQWAMLRFTAHRARWVAAESWHPQQRGTWDDAGYWLLELPYTNPRELEMDILRHMPHVEVLAPAELRHSLVEKMREGLRANASDSDAGSGFDTRGLDD